MVNDLVSYVTGTIISDLETREITINNETKTFTWFLVSVQRKSDAVDVVEMLFSANTNGICRGDHVKASGQICSYYDNTRVVGKLRVCLNVWCIYPTMYTTNKNFILFNATLTQKPNIRKTPSGKNICDLMFAVNSDGFFKACYIPSIAWGTLALTLQDMRVGDKICIVGRLQSREFTKYINGELVKFQTNEVSINNVSKVSDPMYTMLEE